MGEASVSAGYRASTNFHISARLLATRGRIRLLLKVDVDYKQTSMAQLVQLLELMLHGETFRLELGGCVALAEGDKPVAVIRLGSLADAERLERVAARLPVTFRWKTGHDASRAISVADFEMAQTPHATSYRNTQPGKTDKCVRCGDDVPPEMYNLCMSCEYTPSFDYGSSD